MGMYISLGHMHHHPFAYCCLALVAPACATEHGAFVNQMAHTATPYLARAARQPVSWQPWSREVFALAARLDRPILLYVGAEDCRWCTEMDREVYSDPELGALIDSLFVPVRITANRTLPQYPSTSSGVRKATREKLKTEFDV